MVDREEEMKEVTIVGAGLAGSEAAFFLLKKGYKVHLYERRPLVDDGAHTTDAFGELVCSNSLKSDRLDNACGLLKEEMRKMDSITMEAAMLLGVFLIATEGLFRYVHKIIGKIVYAGDVRRDRKEQKARERRARRRGEE